QRLEGLERLLDRSRRIGLVRQVNVDPLEAEALEARLHLAQDALAREAEVRAVLHRVERLRGDARPVAGLADPVADPLLAPPAAVGVRRVEPAEAELPGGVHDRERLLAALPLPEEGGRRADPAEVAAAEDYLHAVIIAQTPRGQAEACPRDSFDRGGEKRWRSSYPTCRTTTPRSSRTSTRARWRSTTGSTTRPTSTTRTRRSRAPSGRIARSRTSSPRSTSFPRTSVRPSATTPAGTRTTRSSGRS